MATLREALYTLFAASGTITGLVGDRIFAERLPEACARPAVLFITLGGVIDMALDGTLTGVVESRVQVEILAANDRVEDIEALRDGVIALNSGYQAITIDGASFQLLSLDPIDYGSYFADPQGLRYSLDLYVKFGRS